VKILFAVKTLTHQGGGAERVLANISSALAQRGHDVIVVSFDPARGIPFYQFDPSVSFRPLQVGDVRRRTRFSEAFKRIGALRSMARKTRPDVAIGFMHSAYIPLAIATVGTGIPIIGSEHIVFDHYRDRTLERIALRLVSYVLSGMTAVSESMRQTFPPAIRLKMSVIPNPVARRGTVANMEGGKQKTILSVGRLDPQKDQRTLISAFARISDKFPDWRLRIVGEGHLREELESQIRQEKLEGRVDLPGASNDISDEYSRAQLFVLPSKYESFGLVTAEAMMHGLPAIGFADCAGTNELIRDASNGLLVSGTDRVQGLADAMAKLMSSPEDRKRFGLSAQSGTGIVSADVIALEWERLLATHAQQGGLSVGFDPA
jgi:glycosyltransferase involved in cell wall biosynthesis